MSKLTYLLLFYNLSAMKPRKMYNEEKHSPFGDSVSQQGRKNCLPFGSSISNIETFDKKYIDPLDKKNVSQKSNISYASTCGVKEKFEDEAIANNVESFEPYISTMLFSKKEDVVDSNRVISDMQELSNIAHYLLKELRIAESIDESTILNIKNLYKDMQKIFESNISENYTNIDKTIFKIIFMKLKLQKITLGYYLYQNSKNIEFVLIFLKEIKTFLEILFKDDFFSEAKILSILMTLKFFNLKKSFLDAVNSQLSNEKSSLNSVNKYIDEIMKLGFESKVKKLKGLLKEDNIKNMISEINQYIHVKSIEKKWISLYLSWADFYLSDDVINFFSKKIEYKKINEYNEIFQTLRLKLHFFLYNTDCDKGSIYAKMDINFILSSFYLLKISIEDFMKNPLHNNNEKQKLIEDFMQYNLNCEKIKSIADKFFYYRNYYALESFENNLQFIDRIISGNVKNHTTSIEEIILYIKDLKQNLEQNNNVQSSENEAYQTMMFSNDPVVSNFIEESQATSAQQSLQIKETD